MHMLLNELSAYKPHASVTAKLFQLFQLLAMGNSTPLPGPVYADFARFHRFMD